MSKVYHLPRCDDLDRKWGLSPGERRELLVEMATKGPGALDKYIRKKAKDKDSSISKRIESLREEMKDQSKRLKRGLRKKYDRRRKRLRKTFARIRARSPEEDFEKRLEEADMRDAISLDELNIEEDSLLDIILDMDRYGRELGRFGRFWFRVKEFFFRIVGAVIRVFVWVLTKLRILRPSEADEDIPPYQFMLSFDSMRAPYAMIETNLTKAISGSPDLAKVVKKKMGGGLKGALRSAWDKITHPGRFRKRVERMIADELKDTLKETREESKRKKEDLERLLEAEQRHQEELQEEEREKVEELTEEEKREMEELYKEISRTPVEKVKEEMTEDLEDMGLLERDEEEISITNRLLEIFSEIVFSMEVKNIPSHYSSKLAGGGVSTGIFKTRKMRSVRETARMDIVRSMVESRIYHPKKRRIYDDNIYVYEEERGTWQHMVLAFDKSGSMADNRKLEAAKRAVLALYKAVRNTNPENVIDLVSFDTRVNVMDLMDVWTSEAGGFTNTGEALNVAGDLLDQTTTRKKSVYLITDGLPEAYTAGGREYAGDFEKSMEYALTNARELRKFPALKFTIILLEIKDEKFINAAKMISDVLDGTIILTNPRKLASELLIEYSKERVA